MPGINHIIPMIFEEVYVIKPDGFKKSYRGFNEECREFF
jgi:hypothetical protein